MTILHQNVRGLFGKIDYVRDILENFNVDILALSETHINDEHPTCFDIPGYTFVYKNLSTGAGGGVAAYISTNIKWVRRNDIESDNAEVLWIEILPFKAKSFLIGTMYRPPDTSKYLPKKL